MKITLQASRSSKDLKGLRDDAEGVVQGSNVYEFDIEIDGDPPTPIADCEHVSAFETYSIKGDSIPRRACPLVPLQGAPEKGPPSKRFSSVRLVDCVVSCEHASKPIIAMVRDRQRILEGFAKQLKKENFSGTPLTEDDRDVRKWAVDWSAISW